MSISQMLVFVIAGLLMLPTGMVIAADEKQKPEQAKQQVQVQEQDKMIYGWQLMTPQERKEHRAKMLSLKTEQERLAYQNEHHKLMQQRAKERGLSIPDHPMRQGAGRGSGQGSR